MDDQSLSKQELIDRLRATERLLKTKTDEAAQYIYHLERMNATPWWRFAKAFDRFTKDLFSGFSKKSLKSSDVELKHTSVLSPSKENIVVICHEASRTGAPILGLNIIREFAKRYNVIAVLMRDGSITAAFENDAAVVVNLSGKTGAGEIQPAIESIISAYSPKFVIANSVATRDLVPAFVRQGVATIALVHEFGSSVWPPGSLSELYDCASAVVFPAHIVAKDSIESYPALAGKNVHVIPQGPSELPPRQGEEDCLVLENVLGDVIRSSTEDNTFIVVGMGTVCARKGVEFFIQCASMACAMASKRKIRFVWIGRPLSGDPLYALDLRQQIQRSGIEGDVTLIDECDDLRPIYSIAGAFFLSSRLDPLPNVAIDAALSGVPVVCFREASGMSEILDADLDTKSLVVPYLDTFQAASVIVEMSENPERRAALSGAIRARAVATFDMSEYVEAIDRIGLELRQAGTG